MCQRHFETANCIELPFASLNSREHARLANCTSRGDTALVLLSCSFQFAEVEFIASDAGLPLGRGAARPGGPCSIRDEYDRFERTKLMRIDRKHFSAHRGDNGDRYIDGVLFHQYSCVLAGSHHEVILVRLAAGEFALD